MRSQSNSNFSRLGKKKEPEKATETEGKWAGERSVEFCASEVIFNYTGRFRRVR